MWNQPARVSTGITNIYPRAPHRQVHRVRVRFTHRVFAARPELDRVAGRKLPRSASKASGTKKGREHEREQDAPVGGRVVEEMSVRALFIEFFIVIILAVSHSPRDRRAQRQAEDDRQRERDCSKGNAAEVQV